MKYKQTTQVPNVLFDKHLKSITYSELKIVLYIIRQTYGWVTKNGKRKQRDRITHGQFITKTGLSRRIISGTIQSLILKGFIKVTDYKGNLMHDPKLRKGKMGIYYAPCLYSSAECSTNLCKNNQRGVQNRVYNKTNLTKLKRQKSFSSKSKRISDSLRIKQILQNK